jgi:hypothetical protein
MKPLNIIIISAFLYPRICPRSLRATELAKELARQGHKVTLYGALPKFDYSDFEKRYNIKIKDIQFPFFSRLNSGAKISSSLKQNYFISKFRSLTMYPEILLIKKIQNVLKHERSIDLLITIALPYPIHWGATYFRSWFKDKMKNTVWISDCGDPFMGSPFSKHPFYFKYLEQWWCRETDYITVPVEEAKNGYYKEFHEKIRVIPQGFNFSDIELSAYIECEIPHFAYSGMVYPQVRDPRPFLEYLCTLNYLFKFIVYTNKPEMFYPYVDRLADKLEIRFYIPHSELIKELSKMDFLINIKNESSVQQPSKLIDYYLAKRPILPITSIFKEKELFEKFIAGDYEGQMICTNISDYDIINVATKFLKLYQKTE